MARAAGAEQESTMDPELWGNLQNHIHLEIIYAKLPFRHFFQLRVVCKEWDRLASHEAFLNSTYKDCLLQEPYFVLNAFGPDGEVCGLLARDPGTQQWTWTRLPHVGIDYWSAAGLALFDYRFVFNLHTRHLFRLSPPLEQTICLEPLSGMEVDTAARPYQFKIMQGNCDVATQIYDSKTNTWSAKASHKYGSRRGQSMAFAQGVFIARVEDEIVVMYDPAKDVWDHFDPPPSGFCDDFMRGLGAWRDRIFHPSMDHKGIRVWELTNLASREWTEIATMPAELCSWLQYQNNEPFVDPGSYQILVSYCFQWTLIYAWWNENHGVVMGGERFVIFNLEKLEFRKLELPFGPLNQTFPSRGDLYAVW